MTPRTAVLASIFAKAGDRKVYGYSSDDGHGGEMLSQGRCAVVGASATEQRKLFERIDRVCIEGTGKPWTTLPREG